MFRPSSARVRQPSRLVLTGTVALALVALPLGIGSDGPFPDWQTASASGKGNGGGNGKGNAGGNGKGHGKGGRAVGRGLDDDPYQRGHGQGAQPANGPHDVHEFLDGVRSGRAFGLEHRDERVAEAKGRYRDVLGGPGREPGQAPRGGVAYGFSAEESSALIERGWAGPRTADGFRHHGERTRTMVALAKQLGYGARVGALQANFGTPFENGIAGLQAELAAAEQAGDQAEAARLRGELASAIEKAKPGVGPDDSWATADLDVNDDGVVDRRDLEALADGGGQTDQDLARQGS